MFTKEYKLQLRAVVLYQLICQMGGADYFSFYSIKIFDDIGQNGAMANMVVSLGDVLGAILSIWFVEALGRKTSIILGIMAQTVALTGLVVMKVTESYALLYPTCVLYTLGFASVGGAGAPWTEETIPSAGIGIGLGVQWFCTCLIALFGPMMGDKWPGPTGTLIFYCFWCWIGIFVLDWVIIETKGKQMEEIENDYLKFKYRPLILCPKKVLG
jgi:hypothetical protein